MSLLEVEVPSESAHAGAMPPERSDLIQEMDLRPRVAADCPADDFLKFFSTAARADVALMIGETI
jgi:hypothetical protein